MTKEQLIAMGLSEEQATKVMESLNGNFVTKARFNEVNTELNATKTSLAERDGQLETLKKSTGDVEGMKKAIADLQDANKNKDIEHQAEIKQMKFDTALNSALTAGRAKNPETVKPLLKEFLEKAELDGESIKGLDAELRKLSEADDTKFLFDAEVKQDGKLGFKGFKPGENSNKNKGNGGGDAPKTLADAVKAAYDTTNN